MHFADDRSRIRTVFLYIRQSTDEKAERQVRSLGDRRRDCEALAARIGLEIVEVSSEDRSARAPHNRPVFKRMLKELSYKSPERRRAEGILAWHPDRLSRNALEAGMIIQMLDDALIADMVFPAYAFHNDPSGKKHLFIEFARAKGYTDRLSQVVLRGVTNREKAGAMVYLVKFGYRKRREDPTNPRLCSLFPIPDPVDFPILQRIFALRLEGLSVERVRETLRDEGAAPTRATLTKSRISAWLADPFYHGWWVVNAGTPGERITDLNAIALPDGTRFTPVVSEADFWRCQRNAASAAKARPIRRHTNPLAAPVLCGACGRPMRPATRKIKRAGGERVPQLGYECQTVHPDGARCGQGRVKADLIFNAIAAELRSAAFTQADCHRFLIGMTRWVEGKTAEMRSERLRLAGEIDRLKKRRVESLRRKAALVEAGEYGAEDRKLHEAEIAEVSTALKRAEARRREIGENIAERKTRFTEFIELCQNLHGIWLSADPAKKRVISEKLLLNLEVEGREIRSLSWKAPFEAWRNRPKIPSGHPHGTDIEPACKPLWNAINAADASTGWRDLLELDAAAEAGTGDPVA